MRNKLSISPASMNLVLVGVAYQRGLLPISAASLRRAIELNATAVDANLAAFDAGRAIGAGRTLDELLASGSDARSASTQVASGAKPLSASLESAVSAIAVSPSVAGYLRVLAAELVAYQDEALARRFVDRMASVANAVNGSEHADEAVTNVAFGLHKLMAYKDEYEVARLLLAASSDQPKTTWLLHPPVLRAMGMKRKIRLGPWAKPVMITLARGKKLRGRVIDPFGRADVRKVERRLITEFEAAIDTLTSSGSSGRGSTTVSPASPPSAELLARLGRLPDLVRGYEHVKLANVERFHAALTECLTEARSNRTPT
jgi:indolepyruvate ferredoxin oxidoreductase